MSQSGETADVIEAMLAARERGARLAALVNVPRLTLDRMVDLRVHLGAGPEQCVLSTKAYTAKVATLLLAAHALAGSYERGRAAGNARGRRRCGWMLTDSWLSRIHEVARSRSTGRPSLYHRSADSPIRRRLEAALKIKEVSYIHAEGFAGGELKHGVIALIEPGTPCVVYAPNDETRTDILSGAMELKSRGGYIIGVGPTCDPVFDVHLPTPDVGDAAPLVQALPAQDARLPRRAPARQRSRQTAQPRQERHGEVNRETGHPIFVDTHAHLDDGRFERDLDAVLDAAAKVGVRHIVNIGYRPLRWRTSIALARRRPDVSFTLGLHPHHADEFQRAALLTDLAAQIETDRPVALGEIGLDYFRDFADRGAQRTRPRRAIANSPRRRGLPVVIHMRGEVERRSEGRTRSRGSRSCLRAPQLRRKRRVRRLCARSRILFRCWRVS